MCIVTRQAGMARLLLASALLLLQGVGCTGADSDLLPGGVPTFAGIVDLEFGETEGDEPYLFTRVESIVEDRTGRILVADMQSHEVRVFDSQGRFLFRFGGEGEGPGELTGPCCLAFGPDGVLWVRESTRYSAFQIDAAGARYDRGLRIAHGDVGMVAPVTFDAEGRLVDVGTLTSPEGEAVTARFHRESDGSVDTVAMADPDRQATGSTAVSRTFRDMQMSFFVRQPFGPRWMHGHGSGGAWAEAITSEYSVDVHRPDGTMLRIERSQLRGPPLSRDERERAAALVDRDLRRLDLSNHPFGIPERKPALADLFFDRSDRLWVEKTPADGDELREADVYEGAELVARYRWPAGVRVGGVPWVTESLLYGTTRDSLDVQRVVRVRFHPASEAGASSRH